MNNSLSLAVAATLFFASTPPAPPETPAPVPAPPSATTTFPSRFTVRTTGGTCLTRDQFNSPTSESDDVITRQCGEWGQAWKRYPVGQPWSNLFRISDDAEFTCLEADSREGFNLRYVFRMCEDGNPQQQVTFIPRGGRVLLSINPARCASVFGDPREVNRMVGEQWCDVYDPQQLFTIVDLPEAPPQRPTQAPAEHRPSR